MSDERKDRSRGARYASGGGDAVYGLGFVGSLVYFMGHAHSLGEGLLGVLKSVVWPALVVYHLLGFLRM